MQVVQIGFEKWRSFSAPISLGVKWQLSNKVYYQVKNELRNHVRETVLGNVRTAIKQQLDMRLMK